MLFDSNFSRTLTLTFSSVTLGDEQEIETGGCAKCLFGRQTNTFVFFIFIFVFKFVFVLFDVD